MRSVPDQPMQLHVTELAVHELLRLADNLSSTSLLKPQPDASPAPCPSSSRSAQLPQPAAAVHSLDKRGCDQKLASGASAACVVVRNATPLDLTVGQAGTDEQLSLPHSQTLQYK